ncbi:MAG TPA: selenium cofactor biosynthesis protein YqeC [Candidatus Deferrimicrobium sp.]|nr:selenium cofactor biosynthesis protein YqeC [Candidatus Deferrimicrobium sp.]
MEFGSLFEMTGFARIVTFIGAGGKSTCLLSLAQEISTAGEKVIATTSTKVFPMPFAHAEKSVLLHEAESYPYFWFVESESESGKWIGPSIETIDAATCLSERQQHFWVIEGDGARRQRLKCWAPHEPQIPLSTECAVLVLDGGLLGKIIDSQDIHRVELFQGPLGVVWNLQHAWEYLLSSPIFAPRYHKMSWVILCNEFAGHLGNVDIEELAKVGFSALQGYHDSAMLPLHLRVAAGDAKEGKLRWYDLW